MGSIKHRKTSTVPNALNDTRRIGGDDWNNDHDIDLEVADVDGLEARLIPVDQVVQYRDDALAYRNQASGFADDAAQSATDAEDVVDSLAADDGATKVGTPEGTVQDALNGRVIHVLNIASLEALPPPAGRAVATVAGYLNPGDAGPAKTFLWVAASALPHDGLCVIRPTSLPANGRWEWRGTIDPRWAGAVSGGVVDCAAAFIAMASVTRTYKLSWVIPDGDLLVDANQVLQFTTGGNCMGRVLIPKANKACRFEFIRDDVGTVLDTSAWATLNRGAFALTAANAAGKNVYLASSQVLIERIDNASYVRQEMIRFRGNSGSATTPLVCTYDDKSKLLATAFEPSSPITVNDLVVVRTGPEGGVETSIGSVFVGRDNVTMNSPAVINDNPAEPLVIGFILRQCCDVTLNKPRAVGLVYSGAGYGILRSATIGVVINDAEFGDCREALSGRHNVDTVVNGGTWAQMIDDHWGDRMVINNAVIRTDAGGACVGYAGSDITLNDCTFIGGRSILVIRQDTPSLGGRVIINRGRWITYGSPTLYGVSFSTPSGPTAAQLLIFTQPLTMPDLIEVNSLSIESDATTAYVVYAEALKCPHTNWGAIAINGFGQRKGSFVLVGVFGMKNSTYQLNRALRAEVRGPMKLSAVDIPVYMTDSDGVATRGASLLFSGVEGGSPRFSPFSADSAQFVGGVVHSVANDKGAGAGTFATQRYTLTGVEMAGGAIGVHSNIAFQQCVFNGVYTNLAPLSTGTYVGCVKTPTGNIGAIKNITDNVVAPFSAPSYTASATYNPPSLAVGASATTTLTITGAALGDYVSGLSFSLDLQGISLTAYVSAADTVTIVFSNTTAGVVDLGSGTLKAKLVKA